MLRPCWIYLFDDALGDSASVGESVSDHVKSLAAVVIDGDQADGVSLGEVEEYGRVASSASVFTRTSSNAMAPAASAGPGSHYPHRCRWWSALSPQLSTGIRVPPWRGTSMRRRRTRRRSLAALCRHTSGYPSPQPHPVEPSFICAAGVQNRVDPAVPALAGTSSSMATCQNRCPTAR